MFFSGIELTQLAYIWRKYNGAPTFDSNHLHETFDRNIWLIMLSFNHPLCSINPNNDFVLPKNYEGVCSVRMLSY
jgi:hypothetical protein